MSSMFFGAESFSQEISSWKPEKIHEKPHQFDDNSGFENEEKIQPQWGNPHT